MKYITEVTRQDIFDIIKYGFKLSSSDSNKYFKQGILLPNNVLEIKMPFYGRLSEIDFLERLYQLKSMPTSDSRYHNAYDDIWQHRIRNDDWDDYWFFNDDRFKLSFGSEDEPLLRFMCQMLHPVVRNEELPWESYLLKFNELLREDGYELYEKENISGRNVYDFRRLNSIEIKTPVTSIMYELKQISFGSYAKVFRFHDKFYDQDFALKRANSDLDEKELERFHREFIDMKGLNSPYVLKVYSYDDEKKQYIMELADDSLANYICKNNAKLDDTIRKRLILQIFKAFNYIHSKNLLHRDICPKNILIKQYEDTLLIKISDFGFVKETDSELTSDLSNIIGYCNDPQLKIDGFKNYNILHEIYALTLVVVYVWTGKTNLSKIEDVNLRCFFEKGMNADKAKRFQTLEEMEKEFFKTISK